MTSKILDFRPHAFMQGSIFRANAEVRGLNAEKKGRKVKGGQEQLKSSGVKRGEGAPGTGGELGQDKERSGNKAGIRPHPAGAGTQLAQPPQHNRQSRWGHGREGLGDLIPGISLGF